MAPLPKLSAALSAAGLSAVFLGLTLAAPAARADNVYWSVGVSPAPGVAVTAGNAPPPRVYVTPQPVYVAPAPSVYTVPQTVYTPPQVVYTTPPVVYTPPQVVYAPSAYYYSQPAPYFMPPGHGHHRHHGHDGRYRY